MMLGDTPAVLICTTYLSRDGGPTSDMHIHCSSNATVTSNSTWWRYYIHYYWPALMIGYTHEAMICVSCSKQHFSCLFVSSIM